MVIVAVLVRVATHTHPHTKIIEIMLVMFIFPSHPACGLTTWSWPTKTQGPVQQDNSYDVQNIVYKNVAYGYNF